MRAAGGQVGGDEEVAVEAGPEPVGEQLVGAAAGEAVGAVAGIGEAEPQPEHRCGEGQQHGEAGDGGGPGAALHDPAPPERQGAPRVAGAAEERDVQPVDGGADEAEHGRQQGHRQRHHDPDRQGRAEGDAVQVGQPHDDHAEQADHHRGPGEQHRPAGGADRGDDRVAAGGDRRGGRCGSG